MQYNLHWIECVGRYEQGSSRVCHQCQVAQVCFGLLLYLDTGLCWKHPSARICTGFGMKMCSAVDNKDYEPSCKKLECQDSIWQDTSIQSMITL